MEDKAAQFHHTRFIPALDHGVCKSDTIVGSHLNIALRSSLRRLERLRGHYEEPGAKSLKNFVVDQDLYPLSFGLTRYRLSVMSTFEDCIKLSGKGISRSLLSTKGNGRLDERSSYKIDNAWSLNYQWLPCDISFEEDTGKARYVVAATIQF